MKYYKAKAYKVDQGTAKYIADVVVKEEFALLTSFCKLNGILIKKNSK